MSAEHLDPAALQILISRLTGVAEEMGAVLRRAAFSPNIKERADCSAALFTAAGELLVQAEHIPVHLGSMPAAVAAAIAAVGGVTADPATRSCSTIPSPAARTSTTSRSSSPCFVRDRAGRLGGEPRPPRRPRRDGAGLDAAGRDRDLPGGPAHPAGAPRRRRGGDPGREHRARPPSAPATSTRSAAPTGSASSACARIVEALGSAAPLDEIVDYGERRMRAALAALPDGEWRFEDVLDSAGPAPAQQSPTRIVVTLTVDGDGATFDFTGTDAAARRERQRGRGGDRAARWRSPLRRRRTRRSRRTAARCGPCA